MNRINELSDIKWPNGKKFVLCLTHDVDRVKKTYQYFTHLVKSRNLYHLRSFFQKSEPYWNFERIIEIEEKYGVRSTFFFLNETKKFELLNPKNWIASLGRYNIAETKIGETIKRLNTGGWEIGLHGSFDSYKEFELLRIQKNELENILGAEVPGIRQHHLNLDIPETWEIHHELGFQYDSSFGFSDRIGFKDQKYLPFYPIDSSLLEIPLSIMDSALLMYGYDEEQMWRECKKMIDIAAEKNAVLTILWHQRVFNEAEFPGLSRIYERIIKESQNANAWITTCLGVMDWVKNTQKK